MFVVTFCLFSCKTLKKSISFFFFFLWSVRDFSQDGKRQVGNNSVTDLYYLVTGDRIFLFSFFIILDDI